jgi:glycosyltransferase involved in cell wall biosynthesis
VRNRFASPHKHVIAEGLFSYQIGGSERVGVDLAREFVRSGHDVVCFAFYDSDGPMRRELERANIRCLDLNYERYRGVSRRVAYQWDFWRMLRRERVDALHVHHATALILCGVPAVFAGVSKVVMTEHGLHQLRERANYRRSAARYCRFADEITVVEPAQVGYFHRELHVPLRKLHYVPNGVHLTKRSDAERTSARSRLGVTDDQFVFLCVGRLNPVKDLGTLIRAVSLLPEDITQSVRLYLAGEGSERATLEQLRDHLGLNRKVMFLGARGDVAELLNAGDGFVMSSKTEGLPMALLEAMAAGLPCVATAVGGIPQLLADGRGLLVPPEDAASLAHAMAAIVRSPQLAKELTAAALLSVERDYDLRAVTQRYLTLLGLS